MAGMGHVGRPRNPLFNVWVNGEFYCQRTFATHDEAMEWAIKKFPEFYWVGAAYVETHFEIYRKFPWEPESESGKRLPLDK